MRAEDADRGQVTAGGAGRLALVALVFVLLAVAGAVVGGTGAATAGGTGAATDGPTAIDAEGVSDTHGSGDGGEGTRRTGAPITECFVGEGYPLSIGDGSATIDAVVHASVLTDPTAGEEFGVELAGSLDGDPLVTLAAGVRFDAPGLLATGVNPFAAFDLLYTYELRLPMFDGAIGDSEHREDRPPVGSAAGTVPC